MNRQDASHEDHDRAQNDAHTIALELMKQLITLSSGVLALSATFIAATTTEVSAYFIILLLAWICLAGSLFFSLQTVSVIINSRLDSDIDWSMGAGRIYAALSKYLFFGGLVLFAIFAFISLFTSNPCPS
ncbi:MAG: hypothetical protein GTO18_14815 [Anaerolineales bacterium]|nr:hypothetical protein [Anaerolineales bacterium]